MDWGLDLTDHLDLNHDGIADVHHGTLDVDHNGIDDFIEHPLNVDLDADQVPDLTDSHVDINHDSVSDVHHGLIDISHPIAGTDLLGIINANLDWPDPF